MEFLAAADKEINTLVAKGTWKEDQNSNATTKILPSQWVFKIKCTPDGQIKTFKAHICLRGDLQEDNGQSNHSPVASCSTVRLFLTKSHQLQWMTTSVNFSIHLCRVIHPRMIPCGCTFPMATAQVWDLITAHGWSKVCVGTNGPTLVVQTLWRSIQEVGTCAIKAQPVSVVW